MGEFDITDVIDGIKEFCSDVVEKVVNFFKGLFSNEEQQDDTETFTEEECKNGVSETEVSDDTECTCDACVICTNATEDSIPIHLKKDDVLIHLSGIGRLNKMDIELDGHFLGCVKGGECSVDKDSIEGGMWQEVDDGNDEGEDKEILNRDKSYMICTKNEGIIYFYDDGQEILDNRDEILLRYRTTFDQDLYDNNRFYKMTADNISEIGKMAETLDGISLGDIREAYNSHRERYEAISEQSGIPPELIAAIHYRENSDDFLNGSFGIYLHNGDPLGTESKKVPQPDLFGIGQFDEAALDALKGEDGYLVDRATQLNLKSDSKDLTAMVTFSLFYNGWPTKSNGKTNYAYNGTDIISKGLYISDGNYDAEAVDSNFGTYLVLKTLLNQ